MLPKRIEIIKMVSILERPITEQIVKVAGCQKRSLWKKARLVRDSTTGSSMNLELHPLRLLLTTFVKCEGAIAILRLQQPRKQPSATVMRLDAVEQNRTASKELQLMKA